MTFADFRPNLLIQYEGVCPYRPISYERYRLFERSETQSRNLLEKYFQIDLSIPLRFSREDDAFY
ncbi:hypothetical protein SAMN04488511_105164 [Pedobacter suwonensis]|uniref:Uncharacterized protein n=1 Tax=Pedobacter suwonensis TaxID=332999 RepID=A0A1I0T210_9SPHI|nr:hypothetical protein SAMN04488511_105164 [Pedobacter suwonensis]